MGLCATILTASGTRTPWNNDGTDREKAFAKAQRRDMVDAPFRVLPVVRAGLPGRASVPHRILRIPVVLP